VNDFRSRHGYKFRLIGGLKMGLVN
jgi:hypothetical protein